MSTFAGGITQATVTVSSTSVPVNIMPPGAKPNNWLIKAREGNTQTVLIFAYANGLPNAAPPDTYELAAGQSVGNSVLAGAPPVGWAMVLGSAGTATVDAIWQ